MQFMSRLAALIPSPKVHGQRHCGILASAHSLRKHIVLDSEKKKVYQPGGPCKEPKLVKNTKWAQLLSRIFEIDVGKCHACASEMRIISFLFDDIEIERYLKHVGLARDPPDQKIFPFELEPT